MIKGLDQLQRNLKEAQDVLRELDGTLCTVNFDPFDPTSIEGAIQKVNNEIDQRAGAYASNPLVAPLIEDMKEHYRSHILEKAAEHRLKGEDE